MPSYKAFEIGEAEPHFASMLSGYRQTRHGFRRPKANLMAVRLSPLEEKVSNPDSDMLSLSTRMRNMPTQQRVPPLKLPEPEMEPHNGMPCETLPELPMATPEAPQTLSSSEAFFPQNEMQDQEPDEGSLTGHFEAICFEIGTPTANDANCHFIGTPTTEGFNLMDDDVDECFECDDCDDGCADIDKSATVLDKLRKQAALRFLTAAKNNQLQSALQVASKSAVQQSAHQKEDGANQSANTEVASPADLSVLDTLRNQAAMRFLIAAKNDQLQSALQVATQPAAHPPVQQNEDAVIRCNIADKIKPEERSLLQQLRLRASLGMVTAARAGNLGSILQTSSSSVASETTVSCGSPASETTTCCSTPVRTPPRNPRKTMSAPAWMTGLPTDFHYDCFVSAFVTKTPRVGRPALWRRHSCSSC